MKFCKQVITAEYNYSVQTAVIAYSDTTNLHSLGPTNAQQTIIAHFCCAKGSSSV